MLIVAGPSASGKTTLGRKVAAHLGWAFEDADDYHSASANAKMRRGEGLTDADRAPWLSRLEALVRARALSGPPTVLACSALKASYREGLLAPGARLVWLSVPEHALRERLERREGHVAGPDLLPSQLAASQTPTPDESATLVVDGTDSFADLVDEIARSLT